MYTETREDEGLVVKRGRGTSRAEREAPQDPARSIVRNSDVRENRKSATVEARKTTKEKEKKGFLPKEESMPYSTAIPIERDSVQQSEPSRQVFVSLFGCLCSMESFSYRRYGCAAASSNQYAVPGHRWWKQCKEREMFMTVVKREKCFVTSVAEKETCYTRGFRRRRNAHPSSRASSRRSQPCHSFPGTAEGTAGHEEPEAWACCWHLRTSCW